MEVQHTPAAAAARDGTNATPPTAAPGSSGRLAGDTVGVALGAWQAAELRLARSFGECRGLSVEQLEDLYQDTAVVLLGRTFHNEDHLRNALRWGIKHRALHMHRDRRRREEILIEHAPDIQLAAERRQHAHAPEDAAVLDGDRIIVSEFLTELDALERRIFWLTAEGLRYRSIAPILEVSVNEARKAARSCERKRERFQILYDSGRLCGYRAQTITAIKHGQQVSAELAQRAYTHVHGCAACRAQHNTNALKLKAAFMAHAAALAPLPLLTGRLPFIARLGLRARNLAARLVPHTIQTPGGGVLRERAVTLLATGGAAGKLAAGAAAVAVIAGGTIGATRALQHHTWPPDTARRTRHAARLDSRNSNNVNNSEDAAAIAAAVHAVAGSRAQGHVVRTEHGSGASGQQEPGGFAYLGVPNQARQGRHETRPQQASAASTNAPQPAEETARQPEPAGEDQHGGGPFTP